MFNTAKTPRLIRFALCALPLASLLLAGCGTTLGTPKLHDKKVVTVKAATGKVQLSFKGLAAYKALATQKDVASLTVTLRGHGSKGAWEMMERLDTKQLRKPMVYVNFSGVPTGWADMSVTAYAGDGAQIGFGNNGTQVATGATAQLHVKVSLTPEPGHGDVDGIITFEETPDQPPMPPRDSEERFRAADADADGWLSLKEFLASNYGDTWGGNTVSPAVCWAMPTDGVEPNTETTTGVVEARRLSMVPLIAPGEYYPQPDCVVPPQCPTPYAPGEQEFHNRDANGDGRLSLAEFRGPWAYPVPATTAAPVTGVTPAQE